MVSGGGGSAEISTTGTFTFNNSSNSMPYILGSRRDKTSWANASSASRAISRATYSKTILTAENEEICFFGPAHQNTSGIYYNDWSDKITLTDKPFEGITVTGGDYDFLEGDVGYITAIWSGYVSGKGTDIVLSSNGETRLLNLKYEVLQNGVNIPELYNMTYQDFLNGTNLYVSRDDRSSGSVTMVPRLVVIQITKEL